MSALILDGTACAQRINQHTAQRVAHTPLVQQGYIIILLLTDDPASLAYVRMKQRTGAQIGLQVRIVTAEELPELTTQHVIDTIQHYNTDPQCLGLMVQLPLPVSLQPDYYQIVSTIHPTRDIDGLSGHGRGQYLIGGPGLLPATPAGILLLLDEYQLGDVQGQVVTIIGQSPLVGLPLTTALIQRGATVLSANKWTNPELLCDYTRSSDMIISATGVPHLIGPKHINTNKKQTLIDVGRSRLDGVVCGDMQFDALVDHVGAITPVPGGVGPMTIAALFRAVEVLRQQKQR